MKSDLVSVEFVQLDQDLEGLICRAEAVSETLSMLNIREAVTHSGQRYKHDVANDTKYVAFEGICIELRKNTIAITKERQNAGIDGTLAETTHLTQSLQGAMTGLSQSTVSRRRKTP